jgi:hypothetical protein
MRRVLGRLPVVLGCFLGHRGSPTPGATQRSTARSSAPYFSGKSGHALALDRQGRLLGGGKLGGGVAAREEMARAIGGHLDRRVAEAALHNFDRETRNAESRAGVHRLPSLTAFIARR